MTLPRVLLLVSAACLSLLCLMLLVIPGAAMGRVLVDFRGHGLHQGDLPALGIWAIGMGACALGWRRA